MSTSDPQNDPFLYNYFRRELWLDRFASVNDVIDTNFKLWRSVLGMLPDFSAGVLAQQIQAAGGDEQERFIPLQWLLSELQRQPGALAPRPGEAPFDSDFEIKQLLNLYTLNFNLNNFEEVRLQGTVRDLPFEQEESALPPVHLIRECFRNVAMDAEIIQRAMVQRRREFDSEGSAIMSAQGRALLVTDKLAAMALAPVQHLLPGTPQITPITYFSPRTHIRQVPYSAGAVLVGIRYDGMVVETNRRFASTEEVYAQHPPLPAFELMAIPHEVGHYVYHHARLDGGASFETLSDSLQNNAHHAWSEELFADLYGCAVAGPLAVLGLQALLAFGDEEMLEDDDGEHPTSLTRPLILSNMLRLLSAKRPDRYSLSQVAAALDENWAVLLQRRGYRLTRNGGAVSTVTTATGERVDVALMLAETQKIVSAFLDPLIAHLSFEPWGVVQQGQLSAAIPWSRSDNRDLMRYDHEMSALTTSAFARSAVPGHPLITLEQSRYSGLQDFLDHWGDSGPHGTGGHK